MHHNCIHFILPILLFGILLPGNLFAQDTLSANEKKTVVDKYLSAMIRLNVDAMLPYRWEKYLRIGRDGKQSLNDLQFERNMTGFEKSVRTKWTYKIIEIIQDTAIVYETEDSKWYNLLGAGLRKQTVHYIFSGQKLSAYQVVAVENVKGNYRELVNKFVDWLKTTGAKDDRDIFDNDGSLIYSSQSGTKLIGYLKKWHKVTK